MVYNILACYAQDGSGSGKSSCELRTSCANKGSLIKLLPCKLERFSCNLLRNKNVCLVVILSAPGSNPSLFYPWQ
jgi:hypothetical protein